MTCWCGSRLEPETGKHLTVPETNSPWASSHFVLIDGIVTHTRGNPRGEIVLNPTTGPDGEQLCESE